MEIFALASVLDYAHRLLPVFLYVGPDLLMPLTSALAAIAGVLLIFWNRVMGLVRKVWQMVARRDN